jgi:hypothetical protein
VRCGALRGFHLTSDDVRRFQTFEPISAAVARLHDLKWRKSR